MPWTPRPLPQPTEETARKLNSLRTGDEIPPAPCRVLVKDGKPLCKEGVMLLKVKQNEASQ